MRSPTGAPRSARRAEGDRCPRRYRSPRVRPGGRTVPLSPRARRGARHAVRRATDRRSSKCTASNDDRSRDAADGGDGRSEVAGLNDSMPASGGSPDLAAYGGRGLPAEFERLYWERAACTSLPISRRSTSGTKMLSAAILGHGSELLRQWLLPALHRGDLIGCQLFSEPDAGSDLSAVRSSATLHDGDVGVGGRESLDLEGAVQRRRPVHRPDRRRARILMMGSPCSWSTCMTPGVEVRPLRQMNGHASFNQVVLNGVLVPESHRLGRWAKAGRLSGPL